MNRVDDFLERASSNGAEAISCRPDRLGDVLSEIIADEDADPVLYAPDEDGLLSDAVREALTDGRTVVAAPPDGSTRRFAEAAPRAELGICTAPLGLVSHGVVLVGLTRAKEGAVSLMPPATVTVVRSRDLRRTSRELFEYLQSSVQTETGSWIFVAGPSSTADLGSLVQGVHGPARAYVIVLEERDRS